MTEEEAVNGLMQDFEGEEAPQEEVPQEAPAEEAPQEPKNDLPDIRSMLEQTNASIAELKEQVNKKPEEKAEEVDPEEARMIAEAQKKLGLEQLIQQQQELQKQMQFEKDWTAFSREHPDTTQEEMGKWAKDNGFTELLANPKGWQVIYKAMEAQAQPKEKPDNITPSSNKGAETSAFDRIKKGEEVSQIDLGLEILKMSQ